MNDNDLRTYCTDNELNLRITIAWSHYSAYRCILSKWDRPRECWIGMGLTVQDAVDQAKAAYQAHTSDDPKDIERWIRAWANVGNHEQ